MTTRRVQFLVLLLLAVLAAPLAWLFVDSMGGRETAAAGTAVRRDAAVRADLQPGAAPDQRDARVLTEALLAGTEGGLAVPVGVRLPGRGRLEGRVLDRTTGEPVANARVDLQAIPPMGENLLGRMMGAAKTGDAFASRVTPVAVTQTGPGGRFAFEGVRGGQYFLEARGPLHVPELVRSALVAESGAGGPIDLYVRPGGRIAGVVVHPDGTPVAGAKVAAFTGWGGLLTGMRTGELHYEETISTKDGTFLLAGLPPGERYEVAAVGKGFAPTHVLGVEVRAGADAVVRVEVQRGATITGRVFSRDGEGGEPEPLAGADVGVIPRGLRDLHFALEILENTHAVTDATGRYRIEGAPIGETDVAALAPGHLPGKSGVVRSGAGGSAEATDVVLKRGDLVSGRVVDADGAPVENAVVRWNMVDWESLRFDLTMAPMLSQAVEGFEYPRTGPEGRFSAGPFAGEAPFRFEVHCIGFESEYPRWDPAEGDSEITVTLHRGGVIEGIVMDEEAAEPVTRFTLSSEDRIETGVDTPGARNPFSGGLLVEDDSGRFRIDGLSAGEVDIEVSADGYLTAKVEDLQVAEGETRRGVIVKMRRGGTVSGIVVDEAGAPVPGAQVIAIDSDTEIRRRRGRGRGRGRGRTGASSDDQVPAGAMGLAAGLGLLGDRAVVTEADGRFELAGLAQGPVRVSAVHRDFAGSDIVELEMEAGAPLEDVRVMMRKGGALFGRVSDRFDRPVPGANVIVGSPEGLAGDSTAAGGAYDARTDEDGLYRIDHVSGGSYFVVLIRDDAAGSLLSILGTLQFDLVTVPEGEEVRHDILDRSAAACRVHGTVTASGQPVQGGMVFAVALESEGALGLDMKLAPIRPDGTYEFPGLTPGEYSWTIGAEGEGPEARFDVEVPDLPAYNFDLVLPEGGVEGVVRDALTGEPVVRAEVALRALDAPDAPEGLLAQMVLGGGERNPRDWTDDDGAFSFRRIQSGEYQLLVQGPRWGDDSERYAPADPVPLIVGDGFVESGLEILLEPTLVLAGTVVDPDGSPVPGARVSARLAEGPALRSSRESTDDEGRFELRSLRPGTYVVIASADGHAPAIDEGVELGEGGEDELVLQLVRGVRVRALVLAPDGVPAAGALGRLLPVEGPSSVDARQELLGIFSGDRVTGSDGELDLGLFLPGTYRLEVLRGGQKGLLEDVVLEDSPAVDLEVRLE